MSTQFAHCGASPWGVFTFGVQQAASSACCVWSRKKAASPGAALQLCATAALLRSPASSAAFGGKVDADRFLRCSSRKEADQRAGRKRKALEPPLPAGAHDGQMRRAGHANAAHRRPTHRQEPTDGARKKARPLMLQTVAHVAGHQERLRQLRSHRCEPWTLQSYRLPSALMKPAERQAEEHDAIAASLSSSGGVPGVAMLRGKRLRSARSLPRTRWVPPARLHRCPS
jgi:hypothetical protein